MPHFIHVGVSLLATKKQISHTINHAPAVKNDRTPCNTCLVFVTVTGIDSSHFWQYLISVVFIVLLPYLTIIFSSVDHSITAYVLLLFLLNTTSGVLPSLVLLSACLSADQIFSFSVFLHSIENGNTARAAGLSLMSSPDSPIKAGLTSSFSSFGKAFLTSLATWFCSLLPFAFIPRVFIFCFRSLKSVFIH